MESISMANQQTGKIKVQCYSILFQIIIIIIIGVAKLSHPTLSNC